MTPLERFAIRARFSVEQAARVSWYASQSIAGTRLATRVAKDLPKIEPPKIEAPGGVPNRAVLLRHVRELLARDLMNVEAGLYPFPKDEPDGLPGLLQRRARYMADVPKVVTRRAFGRHQDVPRENAARPRYYLQNFHYQTDGWLSEESAALYDTQVETLFYGSAAAMRRQGLVPIAEMASTTDQRDLKLLDVASGSGAFLRDVRNAFPRLPMIASDLSEPYVARARRSAGNSRSCAAVCAAGEQLPFAGNTFPIVSNIYLFHELPPKIRGQVAAEMARVAAPGGKVIVIDSLQTGDTPALDGLLELFPQLFHEPYYRSYLTTDVVALFRDSGLELEASWPAFVSKVFVFKKPMHA